MYVQSIENNEGQWCVPQACSASTSLFERSELKNMRT